MIEYLIIISFLPATNINFHPELIHGLCWKDATLNITYQIRTSSLYILFVVLGLPSTLNTAHHPFLLCISGLMPYNFICCQTGCILSQLTSLNELFTFSVIIKLCGVALMALLPGLIVRKFHKNTKFHVE